jgi:tetratricopeptide (TPR) repeat protein
MSDETNWLEFFQDRERLHADYYLDFAQQHARRDPQAYDQLEAESGNLLKIAAWLAEHNEAERILKLASALWQESDFLRTRGYIQRGLPLLEQALHTARRLGDLRTEFTWLEALAQMRQLIGNPELAQPLYEEALALARKCDEPLYVAHAHLGMGKLLIDMKNLSQAVSWLRKALHCYRQISDYEGQIETLVNLGNLLSLQGNTTEAVTYLEQGLPLAQARQDHHGEAALRYALGYAAALAQEWPRAVIHFEAAIRLARGDGDLFLEVRGLSALGEAWLALGNVQKSVTLLKEALDRQEPIDDVVTKAFTHLYLAKAYQALNDPNNSLIQLRQVYPFRQIPITATLMAEAAWIAADNYLKRGETGLAQIALRDVLNLAPSYMADIRQAAEALLGTIESEEYVSEIGYADLVYLRDKREMMRDEA